MTTTREAEWEGIAAAILARRASGVPFGHQTVLARSHTILARLARRLERADVPCLYFGDFFERPEVRDLLAFLSVIAEPRGIGLLRVAQLPQYGVSAEDVCTLANWRRAQQPVPTMLDALRRLDEVPELSDQGRAGLCRLEQDVAFVTFPMTPHQALLGFLFRRPGYLEGLLADRTVAGQQRRLAVYQLLQFAFAFKRPGTGNPKRAFLDHVRRLEVLDEEKQLRQLPAAARDIDAVRLMTVHAAKGLEFPVVHVATLTTRHFPATNRTEACPAPVGMIPDDDLMTREAEEDSLFFVAMSRAKDVLHLSRPLMAGKQSTKNPSRFLKPIAAHLPKKLEAAATWVLDGPAEPPHPRLARRRPTGAVWSMHEIESYLECPRRYYYESELGLKGNEEESPYLRFHAAIRATAAWLGTTTSPEERRGKFTDQFDADWATHGRPGIPSTCTTRKSPRRCSPRPPPC